MYNIVVHNDLDQHNMCSALLVAFMLFFSGFIGYQVGYDECLRDLDQYEASFQYEDGELEAYTASDDLMHV